MIERTYTLHLECPRCGQASEQIITKRDGNPIPRLNCGDCLMGQVKVIELKVVSVTVNNRGASK